jgi:hypothetical protein
MKNLNSHGLRAGSLSPELDALLHPAQAFTHPRDVLADPDLTINEKRAILASWASDACAVEAAPALRCAPGCQRPVSVDAILEALRDLDKSSVDASAGAWLRRQTRRQSVEDFRLRRARGGGAPGSSLSH